MKNYNLPTRDECLNIIKAHHVPPNIAGHSLVVAKLAVFLARRLKDKGIAIDVDLVESACLLHDIARVCDFAGDTYNGPEKDISQKCKEKWQQLREMYKGMPHEYAAYEILKDKYPLLASTIKKHRYRDIADEEKKPDTWEGKLLYYADKRVMHERIVSLAERLADGHKRNVHFYASPAESKMVTAKIDPLIYELEKQIFEKLDINPLQITNEFIDSFSITDDRLNGRSIE
jgi:putative nucleotidyltransferase with HDIG domain